MMVAQRNIYTYFITQINIYPYISLLCQLGNDILVAIRRPGNYTPEVCLHVITSFKKIVGKGE